MSKVSRVRCVWWCVEVCVVFVEVCVEGVCVCVWRCECEVCEILPRLSAPV